MKKNKIQGKIKQISHSVSQSAQSVNQSLTMHDPRPPNIDEIGLFDRCHPHHDDRGVRKNESKLRNANANEYWYMLSKKQSGFYCS